MASVTIADDGEVLLPPPEPRRSIRVSVRIAAKEEEEKTKAAVLPPPEPRRSIRVSEKNAAKEEEEKKKKAAEKAKEEKEAPGKENSNPKNMTKRKTLYKPRK